MTFQNGFLLILSILFVRRTSGADPEDSSRILFSTQFGKCLQHWQHIMIFSLTPTSPALPIMQFNSSTILQNAIVLHNPLVPQEPRLPKKTAGIIGNIPPIIPAVLKNLDASLLHSISEFAACFELGNFFGFDFDRFAGLRIAALASGSLNY